MKTIAFDRTHPEAPSAPPTKRRSLVLGAGVAGAAAIAATSLPIAPTQVAAAKPTQPESDEKGGYQLTQHVLRYYETAKV